MTQVDLQPTDIPPETLPEVVRAACLQMWESDDPGSGRPLIDKDFIVEGTEYEGSSGSSNYRDAFLAGVNAAITVWVRMVPGPSPTDGVHFAVEQLWVHQRMLLAHDIENTRLLQQVAEASRTFLAKLDEYEHLLPKPGSLAARAGAWGARR